MSLPTSKDAPAITGFPKAYEPEAQVEWSTGLFDCFSNFKTCCLTCWCPCVTFGRVAEIVDKGSKSCGASGALYTMISFLGCGWMYSCLYRTKLRRQYGLKGSDRTDCLAHCLCGPCALSQEYRELQNRGFDMVMGWEGNVEKGHGGVAMIPTVAPMSR